MHCIHCGQQVPDTAKVCGYCGQHLRAGDQFISAQPSGHVPIPHKHQSAAFVIKIIALVLMGLGAVYVPLTTLLGVDYTVRLIYFMPFVIVALMFLAWRWPAVAATLLFIPTFRFSYFFLYSGPLFLASLLLFVSGALTGRRQK